MQALNKAVFILVGLINLAPVIGVISAGQISRLYGIDVDSADLAVLMRHRAVLFGLLGAFLVVAAFRPALQLTAGIAGLVSMLSFVALAYTAGDIGAEVNKVALVDIIASILLVIALILNKKTEESPSRPD